VEGRGWAPRPRSHLQRAPLLQAPTLEVLAVCHQLHCASTHWLVQEQRRRRRRRQQQRYPMQRPVTCLECAVATRGLPMVPPQRPLIAVVPQAGPLLLWQRQRQRAGGGSTSCFGYALATRILLALLQHPLEGVASQVVSLLSRLVRQQQQRRRREGRPTSRFGDAVRGRLLPTERPELLTVATPHARSLASAMLLYQQQQYLPARPRPSSTFAPAFQKNVCAEGKKSRGVQTQSVHWNYNGKALFLSPSLFFSSSFPLGYLPRALFFFRARIHTHIRARLAIRSEGKVAGSWADEEGDEQGNEC